MGIRYDYNELLGKFESELGGLPDDPADWSDEQTKRMEAFEEKLDGMKAKIDESDARVERLKKDRAPVPVQAENPKPVTPKPKPVVEVSRSEKIYKNFGEQLRDIVLVYDPTTAGSDAANEARNRLKECQKRATGVSAEVDSDVGYAIQTDFAGMMLESAIQEDPILSMVDKYEISDNADSARWIDIDETSVATTVFGGVQTYWAGEAETVTASKPKLRERRLELNKLMGLAYASGEAMKHAGFVGDLFQKAFTRAIRYELAAGVIAGNGVGKPLGIINSTALVSQAIETGQTSANPILYKNIVKMKTRMLQEDFARSVWLMHPDMEEYLLSVDFPVGTGGMPVFLPPGGGIASGVPTLMQRPVFHSMHCSAINSVGDIMLIVPDDYMLITKGGVDTADSIYVRFIYDEVTFRFIQYANGIAKTSSALTIKNSSTSRSKYVALAARS